MKAIIHLLFVLFVNNLFAVLPMDSVGIKSIRGKMFVIHKVENKETWYSISRRYNIAMDCIKVVNKEVKNLRTGSEVLVPMNENLNPQNYSKDLVDQAHANAEAITSILTTKHKVMQGETIQKIASRYKISSTDILKWNNLKDGRPEPGQIIVVHASGVGLPYKPWNKNLPENERTINCFETDTTMPDNITETGLALITALPGNFMSRIPEGGWVKITNMANLRQCIIPVEPSIGKNLSASEEVIIQLDKKVAEILLTGDVTYCRVEIQYLSNE